MTAAAVPIVPLISPGQALARVEIALQATIVEQPSAIGGAPSPFGGFPMPGHSFLPPTAAARLAQFMFSR